MRGIWGACILVVTLGCGSPPVEPADASTPTTDSGIRIDGAPPDDGALPDGSVPHDAPPTADEDRDDDGIDDDDDAFPDDPSEFLDSDGDGVGNYADADEDGDGVPDADDAAPFDPAISTRPEVDEAEPNGDDASANPLPTIPVLFRGTLASAGDADHASISTTDDLRYTPRIRRTSGFTASQLVIEATAGDGLVAWPILTAPARGERRATPGEINVRARDARLVFAVTADPPSPDPIGYELEIFLDRDGDGAADDLEDALGSHSANPDFDADGVLDGDELAPASTDVDGDSLPNWLDPDADADGIGDGYELSGDPDRDALPCFVDTDSDGAGDPDSAFADVELSDLDADGRPDYADLDDDGDLVADARDAEPTTALTPALVPDPTVDPSILVVEARIGTDFATGAAVAGEALVVSGSALGTLATTHVLMGATDGRIFDLAPDTLAADELEVTVPDDAAIDRIALLVDGRTSGVSRTVALGPGMPVLFRPNGLLTPGTLTGPPIRGLHLRGARFAIVDDTRRVPLYSVTDTTATGVMETARIRITTSRGDSNTIEMRFGENVSVYAQLPPGALPTLGSLRIESTYGEVMASPIGELRTLQANAGGAELLSVVSPDGRGVGLPCTTLLGWDSFYRIDVTSTAGALGAALAGATSRVAPESVDYLLQRIQEIPETAALASILATRLTTTRCPLDTPTVAMTMAALAQGEAIEALIATELAAGSLLPPLEPISLTATVTPSEAFDIRVRQTTGTGNVEIENHTQLLLSARVIDVATDRILDRHAESWLDDEIIGSQSGVLTLFRSPLQQLTQPNYRNARLEILTGSGNPVEVLTDLERSTSWILFARTCIEKFVLPIIDAALGPAGVDDASLWHLLFQQWSDGLSDVRALFTAGDVRGAISALLSVIIRDFDNLGPITRGIAHLVGHLAGPALTRLGQRLAIKAVPLVGQISALLEVASLASTTINIGVALNDLTSVPNRVDFDVDFGTQVLEADPPEIERANRATTIRLLGSGIRGRGAGGSVVPPVVEVTDLAHGTRTELPADRVAPDGRWLDFTLPAAYVAAVDGPIGVRVRTGGDMAELPQPIAVSFMLEARWVTPTTALAGDEVTIHGVGFGVDERAVRMRFRSPTDEVFDREVDHLNRFEVAATAPRGLMPGGEWQVSVVLRIGDSEEESNRLTLNAEGYDFTGQEFEVHGLENRCTDDPIQEDGYFIFAPFDPPTGRSPLVWSWDTTWHDCDPGLWGWGGDGQFDIITLGGDTCPGNSSRVEVSPDHRTIRFYRQGDAPPCGHYYWATFVY